MRFRALLLFVLPLALFGQKVQEFCAACHTQQVADFETHTHHAKGLSCDICHGPSLKHRNSIGAASPDRVASSDQLAALCGACHTGQAKEYSTSKHGKLVAERSRTRAASCTTCHGTHSLRAGLETERQCAKCHVSLPASCKAQPARKDASVSCMNCHAQHTLQAGGG
ncbi:MAG: cytochrome c3 family protein [Bryobacteraceae bacterium]